MLLKNLKIGTRLGLGFAVVLLLLVLVIITGYWGIKSTSGVTLGMLNVDAQIADNFAIARAIALELRRYEKNMFIRIGSTDERAKKDFPKWNDQVGLLEGKVAELDTLVVEDADKDAVKKIKNGLSEYTAGFKKIYAEIREGKLKNASEADTALGAARDAMNGVNKITAESAEKWHNKMIANKGSISAISSRITWILLSLGVLAMLIGAASSLLLHKSIMKPLKSMLNVLASISEGDLTRQLDISSKDELGQIGVSFNTFINKLNGIITNLAQNTLQLTTAANQLFTISERMATGAEEVAAQAGNVAAASEEMAATSNDIAHNCNLAADGSKQANDAALAGAAVVQQTVQGMNRISERVRESAGTVESLGSRSDQIGAIIGTIEDIADQTNLLALNAAIEAARAGEQGRGFAVVADEVRALAERTTKATKEIGEMIKGIQQETKGAVASMEDGVKEVEKGTTEAAKSGQALQDILNEINQVAMQVNQIATAAEQQTATTSEISNNIQQITEVVQGTTKGAHESVAAANRLAKLAEGLQDGVKFFKTSGSELVILDLARNDHRLFVNKVGAGVKGEMKVTAGELPDHHSCRFGKWYDVEGQELCGTLSSFKAIDGPHERIHKLAKEAVTAANSGDRQTAEKYYREVADLSVKINGLLDDIRTESTRHQTGQNMPARAA
ncbi:MAG: methyl-accepting chemotaxis [Geobacteraceae bacterium]|nr:MAG: methyl-accepting chemotaxis [Geobacteraceae bacterium]